MNKNLSRVLAVVLLLFLHGTIISQIASKRWEFEVASVKRADPAGAPASSGRRVSPAGSVVVTSNRAVYKNATLKSLIAKAYSVELFQISGPAWIDSERYDVVATIPDSTPLEYVPMMLQHLLEERFQVSLHSVTKPHSGYHLGISKGGPKLEVSAEQQPPSPTGTGPSHRTPMASFTSTPGDDLEVMKLNGTTMQALAEILSRILRAPVLDETGLHGKFNVALRISQGVFSQQEANSSAESDYTMSSLFTALHDVGLKMEAGKVPLKFIIVDKAKMLPTNN